jgi:ankyrin repeat protein
MNELIYAAENGDLDEVKAYLSGKTIDIDGTDNYGRTALMRAAINGHLDIAKELIAHKANVNTADNVGWTALMLAATCGYLDIVKELLNAGSDLLYTSEAENFESIVLYQLLYSNNCRYTFNILSKKENLFELSGLGKLELLKAFKFMHENCDKFDKLISREQIDATKASLETCKPFGVLLEEAVSLDISSTENRHKLKDASYHISFILKHNEQYGIDISVYRTKLQKICKDIEVSIDKKYYEFVKYVGEIQNEVKKALPQIAAGKAKIEVKDILSAYVASLPKELASLLTNNIPDVIFAYIFKMTLISEKREADKHIDGVDKTLCATQIFDDLSIIKHEIAELSGLINQAE